MAALEALVPLQDAQALTVRGEDGVSERRRGKVCGPQHSLVPAREGQGAREKGATAKGGEGFTAREAAMGNGARWNARSDHIGHFGQERWTGSLHCQTARNVHPHADVLNAEVKGIDRGPDSRHPRVPEDVVGRGFHVRQGVVQLRITTRGAESVSRANRIMLGFKGETSIKLMGSRT